MAKNAKLPEVFLLCVDGPYDRLPVALFLSAEAALKWASENPPPEDMTDIQTSSPLDAAFYSLGWDNQDNEHANRPFGYQLIRFCPMSAEGLSTVDVSAVIQPYTKYSPEDGPPSFAIDPQQELDWL